MELFDKKFVHFMWDDELEGKEGFFANDIHCLSSFVYTNSKTSRRICTKGSIKFPFTSPTNSSRFKFFYYDPNYDCKRAWAEGKTIQHKQGNVWCDVISPGPGWYDGIEYRIKPEEPKTRLMTYRELAEWLAKGNGQVKVGGEVHIWLDYVTDTDDASIYMTYEIRRWGSDEWIEPTVDVYEKDVKKAKMKCCQNCKHSEEDNKSSTICDECFELSCWEMKEE